MRNFKLLIGLALVVALFAAVPGWGISAAAGPEKLKIVTTLFPQYDFTREIGKDKVDVALLLPPGTESHSFEPSPKDIVNIQKSDLFIYTGEAMEPWAHKLIETIKGKKVVVVDTSAGIELMKEEDHDEHEGEEGEHPFEWAGAFVLKKGEYTWTFAKVDGEYADPQMGMVILPSDKKGPAGIEAVQEKAEKLFAGSAVVKQGSSTLTPGERLYTLKFDNAKGSTVFKISIVKEGTYVFFTEHLPSEFEADEHFFKDAKAADVEAVAQEPAEEHHHHGGKDPHIWLDPVYAQKMVDNIVAGLVKADAKNAGFYKQNGAAYKKRLQELDQKFSDAFKRTKYKTIIYGGHFAFGYFAKRYGLQHISPYSGFAPDAEPTPRRIAELVKKLKESGLKVIYYEELIDPKVARVISNQTGAKMVLLHGAHNVSKKELEAKISYIQIMEENLQKLKQGLGYGQ